MDDLCDDPEHRLTRRQANQARDDFAMILDELDFVKFQLSRLPTRAWLGRTAVMGFGSICVLLALVALLLVR